MFQEMDVKWEPWPCFVRATELPLAMSSLVFSSSCLR